MPNWSAVLPQLVAAAGARDEKARAGAARLAPFLPEVFAYFGINTLHRQAHFIGQACVESDYFRVTEEYASGAAYEGRTDLGNTQPGDGARYKGRGIFQTTGRANYAAAERAMRQIGVIPDVGYVANPRQLARPRDAVWAAGIYWRDHRLQHWADIDDAVKMSRAINRGNPYSLQRANAEDKRALVTVLAAQEIAKS